MSLDILGLTNADQVRSVLGVSTIEVSDQVLEDFGLEADLELDLLGWLPTYATVITDGSTGTPTSVQKRNLLLLKKFSRYFCVSQVITAGETFISQMVSDGNSQTKRYSADWDKISERINGRMSSAKSELDVLVNATAATSHTIMGKSTPDYDPVSHS